MGCHRSLRPLAFVFAAVALLPLALCGQDALATVHGRAVDRDGKPMAGCAVGLFDFGERFDPKALLASPRTTTDAQGRYQLAAQQNHDHVVVVTTKGHQVCVQRLLSENGSVRYVPDALMLPGATLRGRLRDNDGKPVVGAIVRVEDPLTANTFTMAWFESMASSDEKGIFEVPGVPRTGLRVTVKAPGFPAISQLAAHDSPLDCTLVATGFVRGRVLDSDGKPVAGASVAIATVEAQAEVERVPSDADGRFVITAPRASRFRLHAYESKAPHRQFASALLRAPADDVVLTAVAATATGEGRRQVTVRCVDAASKAPIEDFFVSWHLFGASNSIMALLQHPERRQPHHGVAVIDIQWDRYNKTLGTLVVDAPGHGFVTMPVQNDSEAPLVAALPAECFLTGRVLDAETGKPAVGAAVRALPHASLHGGRDPFKEGTLTDADGRYRIGGLAAGNYDVQVYGAGRPASLAAHGTVAAGQESTLDLEVPKARFLEFELVGEIPPNCLGTIHWLPFFSSAGGDTGIMLHAPMSGPPIVSLSSGRTHKLGPIGNGQFRARLRLPTRDRIGSGLTLDLGEVETEGTEVQLPDLRQCVHTGRVRLPSGTPPERIALIARPVRTGREDGFARMANREPLAVCLVADGSFVIDLPPGKYTLRLADLATGFVFFTDEQDRELGPDTAKTPLDLRPTIHWLEIALEPKSPGDDLELGAIGVDLRRPRDGALSALLRETHTKQLDSSQIPVHCGNRTLRWLVPAGPLTVQPLLSFDALRRGGGSTPTATLAAIDIDVRDAVHRVILRIPAPPSDAELERPAK